MQPRHENEPIAHADTDERARDATVVSPRVDRHTCRDLHGSDAPTGDDFGTWFDDEFGPVDEDNAEPSRVR